MNTNKIFTYFLIVILLAGFVSAAKDSFVLDSEKSQNLYLTNSEVAIDSSLYGDLFAFSQRVDINGLVRDDVNAVTSLFDLQGTVGSDVRLISTTTVIDGTVFGEVMIVGNYVKITKDSAIGGPVNINANTVIIDGTLKGDLNVKADKVILNGIVEGNAVITTSSLELGPDAKIMGDLSSTRNVDETSTHVDGIVTKLKGRDDPSNFTSITLSRIGLFLMIFLIGTALILCSRKSTEKTAKAMYSKFLLSMLIGFVALVVAPFVAILLLFTVVGLPLALLIVAIYLMLLILAAGFSAIFIGKLNTKIVKKKNSLWLELLIGALALALVSIIPVIFALVLVFIGFVSVGAMLLVAIGKDKSKDKKK